MNILSKTLAAGAAALTIGLMAAPAEARHFRHHGWHGWHGHHGWGWRHPRPWAPVAVGIGGFGAYCTVKRMRVYDPDIGGYVLVRRRICG